MHTKTDV